MGQFNHGSAGGNESYETETAFYVNLHHIFVLVAS